MSIQSIAMLTLAKTLCEKTTNIFASSFNRIISFVWVNPIAVFYLINMSFFLASGRIKYFFYYIFENKES